MLNKLFNIIAPDHCYGCHKSGTVLCDNCKYDIETETFSGCLLCRRPTLAGKICVEHRLSYSQAWCVGERHDVLERLIDAYKFERNSRAAVATAKLIASKLESLPANIVLVPIPTIAAHIRQRGFDHTKIIVDQAAKRIGCKVAPLLLRQTNTAQRQMSRAVRFRQASEAFKLAESTRLDPDATYVLIDDVFTTGATVEAAAALLLRAGAATVCVVVLARQTLDDKR